MTPPEGPDAALRPGAIVGEYQITHLLGEGGMGVVYAGTHPEIGKRVAIKVLAPHAAQYPDLIRRFKEEARAVNKIRHPNIIDIFAFNQLADGRHYFVMEYLDGESLTARLERGSMEFGEMRRLLGQICSALEAAHEAGVVHRDLKPDNIWVATQHKSESRIKLLDFGIAKLTRPDRTRRPRRPASRWGRRTTCRPSRGWGARSITAPTSTRLGVVLYQIFAGSLPFNGVTGARDRPQARHRAAAATVQPTGRSRRQRWSGSSSIALEKDPDRRPGTMHELSERIDAAFAAEGRRARAARRGAYDDPATADRGGAGGFRAERGRAGRTEVLPASAGVPGLTSGSRRRRRRCAERPASASLSTTT